MKLLHEDFASKMDILKEYFAGFFDKNNNFDLEKFKNEILSNGGGLRKIIV